MLSLLYSPTLTFVHDYWKNHTFSVWTFVGKVRCLLFNTLSRFVITFFQGAGELSTWDVRLIADVIYWAVVGVGGLLLSAQFFMLQVQKVLSLLAADH